MKICKLIIFKNKGQALLETLLTIPVLAAVILIIAFTSDIILTKQQLLMAARYGTDLIYYTNLNEEQVKNEVIDYLNGPKIKGRTLSRIKPEDISIKIERFDELRGISYEKIQEIRDSFFYPEEHTSSIELKYTIPLPNIVSILNIFSYAVNAKLLPKDITVSARSEVLAGTGA